MTDVTPCRTGLRPKSSAALLSRAERSLELAFQRPLRHPYV